MSEPLEGSDWTAVQDAEGVDLEMIRFTLSLTPEERWERRKRGMESILWLKEAREQGFTRESDGREALKP